MISDLGDTDSQQAIADAQQVCLACGLCCRGVWYSYVLLDDGEVNRALQAGLRVQTLDGKASFRQPCVLHRQDACSVYGAWRPKQCKEYTCALLDRYLAGEVTLEKALSHVISARAMADRVQNEVGPSAGALFGKEFSSRVTESVVDEPMAFPPLSSAAKADTIVLHIYFKKYFKK